MLDKEQIVEWLYENCRDEHGNLILSELDLTEFNDVYFNKNEIKGDLHQDKQIVGGGIYQSHQEAGEDLIQGFQKVGKTLLQCNQRVGIRFVNHKLQDDEYWEQGDNWVIRKKRLKKITLEELEQMGYELEGE